MACLALALGLLIAPGLAVRRTELNDPWEDLAAPALGEKPHPRRAADAHALVEVREDHLTCCCWNRPCTWQEEEAWRPFVHNSVPESKFVTGASGNATACCLDAVWMVTLSFFGDYADKCSGGVNVEADFCVEPAVLPSSVPRCKNRLTRWFRREDWYEWLPNSRSSSATSQYQAYVACLAGKRAHVHDVVLHNLSFFEGAGFNEVRMHVLRLQECRSLMRAELEQALEQSFDDMCPFPLKHEAYTPDLQPLTACTYNSTTQFVQLSNSTMCPEGHRCACPTNGQVLDAVDTKSWTHKTGLQGLLDKLTRGWTAGLQYYGIAGTLAAVGMFVGPMLVSDWTGSAWAIGLSGVSAGLIVFGFKSAVDWLSHSCRAKVGCYPMDCVYEEEIGCRINLDLDDSDPRNPYWFMPPPMYKCGVSWRGHCKLSVCTAQDARHQLVGDGIAEYGFFRTLNLSTVYNCQPTLAKDMEYATIRRFEEQVAPLRSEEQELQRRTAILRDQLYRYCPFLQPVDSAQVTCHDNSKWAMVNASAPSGCVNRGGIKQCSQKFPSFCSDSTCDTAIGRCRSRGGMKECAAEDRCAFALPTLVDDTVECGNSKTFPISHFEQERQKRPWCHIEGGLRRCPWNLPMMCNDQSCNGEHCCAKDCSQLGGPKACDDLLIQRLHSGAQNSGQFFLHLLVALMSLVAPRIIQPDS